jgi:hypothetical protein
MWMNGGNFYTLTTATNPTDELLFTRLGANDPEFNLRRDAAFMIRRKGAEDTVFASVVEPHGNYSPVSELAVSSNSNISALRIVYDDENYTAVSIEDQAGHLSMFIVSHTDASAASKHQVEIDGEMHQWTGPYQYTEL